MKRFVMVVMLALAAVVMSGIPAAAGPEEGSRDWFGPPPVCC